MKFPTGFTNIVLAVVMLVLCYSEMRSGSYPEAVLMGGVFFLDLTLAILAVVDK